jgi:hypothetical protein
MMGRGNHMKKYLLAASIFAISGLPVWSAQATPAEAFGKTLLVTEYADYARKDGDSERANHARKDGDSERANHARKDGDSERANHARKDGDRERANHAARENQARGRQDHAAREAQPGDDRGNHGGRHASAGDMDAARLILAREASDAPRGQDNDKHRGRG